MGHVALYVGPTHGKSHPTKFNGHKHHRRGDLMVLLCHLITQDHMSKASSNRWVGAPQGYSPS